MLGQTWGPGRAKRERESLMAVKKTESDIDCASTVKLRLTKFRVPLDLVYFEFDMLFALNVLNDLEVVPLLDYVSNLSLAFHVSDLDVALEFSRTRGAEDVKGVEVDLSDEVAGSKLHFILMEYAEWLVPAVGS